MKVIEDHRQKSENFKTKEYKVTGSSTRKQNTYIIKILFKLLSTSMIFTTSIISHDSHCGNKYNDATKKQFLFDVKTTVY